MKLVCMLTQISTPNQIRSMPRAEATGASIGMTMKAISKKSRKKARTKMKMLTKIRKPTGPPGMPESMCSIQREPSMPWKTRLKQVEPIRIITTMEVMCIVDVIASRISGQVRRPVHGGKRHRADDAERAGFRRRRKTHEDRAEYEEDQHDRGHHAHQHLHQQRPVEVAAHFLRQRRHRFRPEDRQHQDEEHEDRDLQDRGTDRAEIHVADRPAELVGENDEHERGRDDLGDRARRGDDAGRKPRVVAVAQHDRQRDHAHGDDRGSDRAGDGAENGADEDDRVGKAAWNAAEELAGAFEKVLGQTASLQNRTHEGEEGNGEQQIVGDDAEDAKRQGLQEGLAEMAGC